VGRFWRELLGEARRRDVTAVSTDDSAGYGIIVTGSGAESAAKEISGFESAGNLLKFLFTHDAGANPAEYAIFFHWNSPSLISSRVIISRMRRDEAFLREEEIEH
jgi:phage-related tail fiber protein